MTRSLYSLLLLGWCCFSTTCGFAATRPDASQLVEQAMKITAAYGLDSSEAKVAWDILEEVDASDNSVATLPSLDQECEIETTSSECADYGSFLEQLYTLRDSMQHFENKKGSLIDTLKRIQIQPPNPTKALSSPELTMALEEAKQATEVHGVSSVEARLAWETYEDIAGGNGAQAAVGINLMEECSVEVGEEACRAMEELERILPVLLAISEAPSKT